MIDNVQDTMNFKIIIPYYIKIELKCETLILNLTKIPLMYMFAKARRCPDVVPMWSRRAMRLFGTFLVRIFLTIIPQIGQ